MPVADNSTVAKPGSRLRELGLVLPKAPTPFGAYVEASEVGSLLFLSGILPVVDRKLSISGRLGGNLSVEQGREAVRIAAMKFGLLHPINHVLPGSPLAVRLFIL
jgi:YjgF/chorismate_mutase-like, putative endoribonuclease